MFWAGFFKGVYSSSESSKDCQGLALSESLRVRFEVLRLQGGELRGTWSSRFGLRV